MPVVTMKNLLEAGVHFGHQTRRWNPKMKPYIFTERSGIYILDLQRTLRELEHSYSFARSVAQRGGTVLFVGTKKQAQEPIQSEAERCGHAVRQPPLARRHAHQLRDHARPRRPHGAARGHGRRRPHGHAPQEGAAAPRKELGKLQANLNGVRNMTSTSRRDLRRRHQARGHRDPRGPASAHPDHRPRRHQRRSR